ncbi:MarR family winged helix-turn-helix transcriptional regulator [Umezawaea tangerina]|uniref:DNA-binding MarR family transcriptional regulator n=1 Tax=Umezawaea tangerina TaxID=84725 RepID=A0A2T0T9Z9_9PSEU|nr:MarR family transcriptional regulator [Umezawaea tangerina]PRY42469.1 DNA-binding MarR family transcriptional regulator [Umezawaea tangerina]
MTDDPDLLSAAEDLRAAVGDFVRRVLVHHSMPPGQAAALGYLDRTGPLSIAELARLDQVKHQSMARTVGLLKDQGLVTVQAAEADRRQVVVTITDTGARRIAEVRRLRASNIARTLADDLDDEEREIVRRIPEVLRKLQP